ncbi:MAG: signal peptide peptidase SppA [Nitrospirae bacterium]|nr:signal peptide peptidase SppA [Nitrospirota bacterium]
MFKWLSRRLPIGRIAIVPFSGVLSTKTVEPYLRLLKAIEYSKYIKGGIFQIESPGGNAYASEMLYFSLKRLSEKKPVYCYLLMAASGGYMAVCGAEKIFAPPTALIGSIGVLTIKPVLKDIMERLGIRLEVMKKGENKDMTLFHRDSTEEEKKKIDTLQEAIYQRFIEIVAEARRLEKSKVLELATGELYSSRASLEHSLIDRICDFDSVLDEMSRETGIKKEKAIILKPRKPLFQRMAGETISVAVEEIYGRLLMEGLRF